MQIYMCLYTVHVPRHRCYPKKPSTLCRHVCKHVQACTQVGGWLLEQSATVCWCWHHAGTMSVYYVEHVCTHVYTLPEPVIHYVQHMPSLLEACLHDLVQGLCVSVVPGLRCDLARVSLAAVVQCPPLWFSLDGHQILNGMFDGLLCWLVHLRAFVRVCPCVFVAACPCGYVSVYLQLCAPARVLVCASVCPCLHMCASTCVFAAP